MSPACPRCGAAGIRFGTKPGQRLALEDGRLLRIDGVVQRHRCGACRHVYQDGPSLADLDVRDTVVDLAVRHGVANAARMVDADRRTVAGMLSDWVAARADEVCDEAPERIALLFVRVAGADRILALDVENETVLDLFADCAAAGDWLCAGAGPDLVVVDVDQRVLAAVEEAVPTARIAVAPTTARRAIEGAALKTLRGLLREAVARGRNFREPVAAFRKRDRDLNADERGDLSGWSPEVRRLRAVREALFDALENGGQEGLRLFGWAEATVEAHMPKSPLHALLKAWGPAIRAGVEERWVDEAVQAAEPLRRELQRGHARGSFDVARIAVIFLVPVMAVWTAGGRGDGVRRRAIDDALGSLRHLGQAA